MAGLNFVDQAAAASPASVLAGLRPARDLFDAIRSQSTLTSGAERRSLLKDRLALLLKWGPQSADHHKRDSNE